MAQSFLVRVSPVTRCEDALRRTLEWFARYDKK
jgi:hypothetical protein